MHNHNTIKVSTCNYRHARPKLAIRRQCVGELKKHRTLLNSLFPAKMAEYKVGCAFLDGHPVRFPQLRDDDHEEDASFFILTFLYQVRFLKRVWLFENSK